jgi:hypothetical protein
VRWRARKTHKLVQKDYLRRSRNAYGGIALTVWEGLFHIKVGVSKKMGKEYTVVEAYFIARS